MSLQTYRRKRDFAKTPEPKGKRARAAAERLHFVVQKHAATRLHYDFRLELDGTLKSWAIPKGPSLDPGDKRLAVQVEDHPLEYADFEGNIPEKQYGAGEVIVWDRGTWIPDDDPRAAYRSGRLKFRLQGKKLRGGWALVRMRGRATAGKENWLLIKERDAEAHPGEGDALLSARPESVISRRILGEPNAPKPKSTAKSREPKPAGPSRASKPAAKSRPAKTTRSVQGAFPEWLDPELATLVATAPKSGDWRYEVKYDGYRILARVDRHDVRLFTRNGSDWSERYPRITRELAALDLRSTWLDGEVCAITEQGRTSFSALQRALSGDAKYEPVFVLFDAPYVDGRDLRQSPLVERQAELRRVLGRPKRHSVLRLSEMFAGAGEEIRAQACKRGLEGVIGKRADSPYVGQRTRDWIKLKCRQQQEFVITGYTSGSGARKSLGALIVGVYEDDGALHYAGRVGTGFDAAKLRSVREALEPLAVDAPAIVDPPRGRLARDVHWVRPQLVAEVTFAEWTHDGLVRQASFDGLREDKEASQVKREMPRPPPAPAEAGAKKARVRRAASTPSTSRRNVVPKPRTRRATSAPTKPGREAAPRQTRKPRSSASSSEPAVVAGITISSPDRMLYPDERLTKLDIVRYYERVAPVILPYVRNRPLALVRCPSGPASNCFFQKHAAVGDIPGIETVDIEESGGVHPYVIANTVRALVGLAQMNVLELHLWGARSDRLDQPDTLILDLDPDAGLPWQHVIEAATLTHTLLQALGLESFLKTTGGKGLHVVVPLTRRHSWDEVKSFAKACADHLVEAKPDRFTAEASKTKRKGKIFIDYLRNARGALAVAPYSVRARTGATVATPLRWDELSAKLRPAEFNVTSLATRIDREGDPWRGYASVRQTLTSASKKLGAA